MEQQMTATNPHHEKCRSRKGEECSCYVGMKLWSRTNLVPGGHGRRVVDKWHLVVDKTSKTGFYAECGQRIGGGYHGRTDFGYTLPPKPYRCPDCVAKVAAK